MDGTDEIGDDQIKNDSINDINRDKKEEESIAPMVSVRFPQKVAFPQIPTEDMMSTQKRNKQTKVPKEDMLSTQKRIKQTKVRSLPPTARPDSSPTGAPAMILPTATYVIVQSPVITVVLQCPSADIYAAAFNSVDTTKSSKQAILWTVLRTLHKGRLLPGGGMDIGEYLHAVRNHLQQVLQDIVIEIRHTDIVSGSSKQHACN